ncbi:hypothetical protein [Oceaniferula spumae]|uniref:hypothetical protein n=1 Tax=Oceaniferula spumae TaxID=2979115 RepID=UPI003F4EA629
MYDHISPIVGGGLGDPKMGNLIPKAVVVSPDMTTMYGSIAYKQMKASKNFTELNKKVEAALEGKPAGAQPEPQWYVKAGKGSFYKGNMVNLKKNKKNQQIIVLKERSGKVLNVPLGKLTPLAQKMALGQVADKADDKPSAAAELEMESWESAKGGKSIKATFVSLSGGKITLKKDNGQEVTFDLTLLSDKSQSRARELAANN